MTSHQGYRVMEVEAGIYADLCAKRVLRGDYEGAAHFAQMWQDYDHRLKETLKFWAWQREQRAAASYP